MQRFAQRIQSSVQIELEAARRASAQGEPDIAFGHLERAHVLGQAATAAHVRVHWRMLLWAIGQRKAGEAFGQTWRLIAAAMLTRFGWIPSGNTGGASVNGFRRMPIPGDLQRLLVAAQDQATPKRRPLGSTRP